ncbi:MAG: hypothetical protein ACM3OB_03390 [Acidobacteriota bacterium]
MQIGERHSLDLDVPPGAALVALGETAEAWGGEWKRQGDGGDLVLPVLAGLRRGYLLAKVAVEEKQGDRTGAHLDLTVEKAELHVHRQAVAILLIAALASVATVLWPFFPALLALAAPATVIALGAWFLIVSRLKTSGPEDFLKAVAAEAADRA